MHVQVRCVFTIIVFCSVDQEIDTKQSIVSDLLP